VSVFAVEVVLEFAMSVVGNFWLGMNGIVWWFCVVRIRVLRDGEADGENRCDFLVEI
jgi:hypothetical protein